MFRQAPFREGRRHVAEKFTRDDDVLRAENADQLWIRRIPEMPGYPVPEPGFDSGLLTLPIKHFPPFMWAQALKNRGADQLGGIGGYIPFGEAQYFS